MEDIIANQLATITSDLRARIMARDPKAERLLAEMIAGKLRCRR
jgi:hypothetical protein